MPTPFAPRIILSQNLQTNLQALARAHSTPQSLALRARIVLRAADVDTPNNVQMASGDGGTTSSALRAYKMPPARGDRAPFPRAPA